MNFVTTIKKTAKNVGFWTNKHSPELLVGGSIVGFLGAAVLACVATVKTKEDIEEYDTIAENIDSIVKTEVLNEDTGKSELVEYTDDMRAADKNKAKLALVLNTTKHYAPAVILASAATVAAIASNKIMRKRALALAAALSATEGSFAAYRANVKERYGSDVDHELLYGVKKNEIEETAVVNGKEKTVKKEETTINLDKPGPATVMFDADNDYWDQNTDYNMMFLRQVEHALNDRLDRYGFVYLNEAFRELGAEETAIGQVIGWHKDISDVNDTTYIEFDLYDTTNQPFVNLHENKKPIIIRLNPQGYILDKIQSE